MQAYGRLKVPHGKGHRSVVFDQPKPRDGGARVQVEAHEPTALGPLAGPGSVEVRVPVDGGYVVLMLSAVEALRLAATLTDLAPLASGERKATKWLPDMQCPMDHERHVLYPAQETK
jgi:hypothetical protein